MEVLSIKSIDKFYDYLFNHENDFLDMGEDTYNVIQFFNHQKDYFDEAVKTYKIFESNKNFITDTELIDMATQIKSILTMDNPYSKIKDLPQLSKDFIEKHDEIIQKEKLTPENDIKLELDDVLEVLNEDYEFKDELIEKYEKVFINDFDNLSKKLLKATEISVIRGVSDEAFNLRTKCMNIIDEFKKRKSPGPVGPEPQSVDLPVKFIASKSKIKIENDDDLDTFLNQIRDEVKKRFNEYDIVYLKL